MQVTNLSIVNKTMRDIIVTETENIGPSTNSAINIAYQSSSTPSWPHVRPVLAVL